ncbi:hypothetical protein QTP88_015351 [Uroleucon formosanum]
MDHQQNNTTPTSVLSGPNNRLEISENHIVRTDEDAQDVYKLTTDEFAFLNIVADAVRTAMAVRGYANEAPKKKIVTESLETDIWEKTGGDVESLVHNMSTAISKEVRIEKSHRQPARKMQLRKRRNETVSRTTLRMSALLRRALGAAAVCRSLNCVISVNFRLCTTVNGTEVYPFANSAMTGYTETGFRQSTSLEIVMNIENLSADFEPRHVLMPEIRPAVLAAAICSRQTDDDVGFDGDDWPRAAAAIRRLPSQEIYE